MFILVAGIGILLILAISVGYELHLRRRHREELMSWRHSFMATLLGTGLSILTGFMLFYIQGELSEQNRRASLLVLLATEIEDTKQELESQTEAGKGITVEFQTGDSMTVHTSYLQPLLLENAAESGLFGNDETRAMLTLARQVRSYNNWTQYLLSAFDSSSYSNPNFRQQIMLAAKNLEESRARILGNSAALQEMLKMRYGE